jgi:hypothetical protein
LEVMMDEIQGPKAIWNLSEFCTFKFRDFSITLNSYSWTYFKVLYLSIEENIIWIYEIKTREFLETFDYVSESGKYLYIWIPIILQIIPQNGNVLMMQAFNRDCSQRLHDNENLEFKVILQPMKKTA